MDHALKELCRAGMTATRSQLRALDRQFQTARRAATAAGELLGLSEQEQTVRVNARVVDALAGELTRSGIRALCTTRRQFS